MRNDGIITEMAIRVVIDDGGRKASGFKGDAYDCVVRAVAIAMDRPYRDVYQEINEFVKGEKLRRGKVWQLAATGRGSSARTGILIQTSREYINSLGFVWVPTMQIGQGCKVHLRANELPEGRLIVSVSKHLVAVIDRVVHDTHDPSREGTRCVYGYWRMEA